MTTDQFTLMGDETNRATIRRDFGLRDEKGRAIGGSAFLYEVDFTRLTAEQVAERSAKYQTLWTTAPGHYFVFTPHATRDGKSFGALQHPQLFPTAEARDAAVERYFANSQKRYAKQFTPITPAPTPMTAPDTTAAPQSPAPNGDARPGAQARVRAFVLDPSGAVEGYASGRIAARAARDGQFVVNSEKDLIKVPGPVLVAAYNRAIAETPDGEPKPKPVTRFADSETAARRVWPVVEYLGERHVGVAPATTTEETSTMATKTTKRAAKKTSAKKTSGAAKKTSGERRPRGSETAIIRKLPAAKEYAPREGSKRAAAWAAIRDGVKVQSFLANGGNGFDLRVFCEQGYCEVVEPK